MKCVNCDTDNNLEERTANGGRCKNCNHHFAFDPKAGSEFTDVFFKRSIEAISNENTLFFTRKQFLYALEKRLTAKSNTSIALHLVGTVIAFVCVFILLYFIVGMMLTAVSTIIASANKVELIVGFTLAFDILLFLWGNMRGITSKDSSNNTRKNCAITVQIFGLLSIISSIIYSLNYDGSNETKFFVFLIGLGVGLFLIYFAQKKISWSNSIYKRFSHVTPRRVNTCLNRWTEFNSVEKLLPSPKQESSNIEISSDISAYSFDRLLVCETDEIAQFLIANNFHFEHNCAVLSITGYPQNIFSTVMEMLRRNPDLKVYAFHNASPRGIALVNHLRTSNNWFANNEVIIYDLGLFPRHIFSSKNMFVLNSSQSATAAKEMPAAVRQGLSADEIAWLEAGNYVELESFSPQSLLRVASRIVANSQSMSGGEIWNENEGNS